MYYVFTYSSVVCLPVCVHRACLRKLLPPSLTPWMCTVACSALCMRASVHAPHTAVRLAEGFLEQPQVCVYACGCSCLMSECVSMCSGTFWQLTCTEAPASVIVYICCSYKRFRGGYQLSGLACCCLRGRGLQHTAFSGRGPGTRPFTTLSTCYPKCKSATRCSTYLKNYRLALPPDLRSQIRGTVGEMQVLLLHDPPQ